MSDLTTPLSEQEGAGRPVEEALVRELVERARSEGVELVGPGGLLTGLTKTVLETVLEAELDDHLGYAKHAVEGCDKGNSRNGVRPKTLLTEVGEVEIDVPRDLDGSFEYWHQVLSEILNRGTAYVLIVVCDGLRGLPEAIGDVWPLAIVQTCVLHLIRNTFRYASRADWAELARELRPVYTAATEQAAKDRFDELAGKWGKRYPAIVKLWQTAWPEFVPFLAYSPEIRKVIYSTNAIECLHARFRRQRPRPRPLPQRASRREMLVPHHPHPRPHRQRPSPLGHPLKAALNAFAITFEGRIDLNNNQPWQTRLHRKSDRPNEHAMKDRIGAVRRRLDEDLPRLAAVHEVPGVSVAVLMDGRQVAEHAAGVVNLRTGVAVTPDSLFMIQSITKVWTATLVMQLVDDGLVELDAPVRAYLPGFRTADERASRKITTRHLLTHTGGFEGDIWAATTAGEDALQRFVDDHVSAATQYTRPGAMYSYCNAGYGVLGRLLEVLRQLPYPDVLRRFLARPLGISELAFSADEALAFRTAIGHARPTPDAAQQPLRVWAVMPPSNPAAGNQLAMSARGLIAFARMHLADGLAPDGTRVLSHQSARAMRERQVDHPAATGASSGHGLGWMLPNRPGVVEHGGDTIGVAALLRMVPQAGAAVAMLTNGGTVSPLIDELVEPLLSDISGVTAAQRLPSPLAQVGPSELKRYLGRYETRANIHDVTLGEDGRLLLTQSARNEALTMIDTAGIATSPQRHDLGWVGGDTFMLIDPSGAPLRAVEFLGADATSRAQFLHTGRAARRSD